MGIKEATATERWAHLAWLPVSAENEIATPPPLESGDRLARPEFERRYEAMPHVKKAELIEGVVHMPTPVSNLHSQAHGLIITWLGTYSAATPSAHLNDNATVRLDLDNEPQPDALLRLDEALGGQSRVGADGYVEGAPEFIAEVAASSASYDLHDKLNAYRRNGVQEYLVWRLYDGKIDWFRLRKGEYTPLDADEEGIVESEVFPGLRLDVPALLKGNLAQVLATLQKGLEADKHQAFVERLSER
jgi:Uma2 family endonuclease